MPSILGLSAMAAPAPDFDSNTALGLSRGRKRPRTAGEATIGNPRRAPKASRACDTCKAKKARCSGTMPCTRCAERGLACLYDASYTRGRPPTPPPGPSTPLPRQATGLDVPGWSPQSLAVTTDASTTRPAPRLGATAHQEQAPASESVTRRGSPELEPLEIGGQYVEQTSGLAFLHRAHMRLLSQNGAGSSAAAVEGVVQPMTVSHPLMAAGDKPMLDSPARATRTSDRDGDGSRVRLPSGAASLMAFYFDTCVVTYRILHRQTTEGWLRTMEQGMDAHEANKGSLYHAVGEAKAAVLLTVLAISIQKQARMLIYATPGSEGECDEDEVLRESDSYFSLAAGLIQAETGLPKLESAQARLLQVLYLLQTSRVNQAWYLLGTVSQIVSALGLHRNRKAAAGRPRPNYIQQQCGRRAFWVLYIIDVYLSVVLGRPRYLHDDNIDQVYPDSIADEEMTPNGEPAASMGNVQNKNDSPMEALVQHAKLGRIIAATCREIYAIGPTPSRKDRLHLAAGFDGQLHEWRAALPPLLGAVRPSSLVPSFRRQSVALQLAHTHAIMHATRPFLLSNWGKTSRTGVEGQSTEQHHSSRRAMVAECLKAAQTALELIDSIAGDESLSHAFWWSHYVNFCAIAVVFVSEIQQSTSDAGLQEQQAAPEHEHLFALAERCHSHLARVPFADAPWRRYTVILEELRLEARHHQSVKNTPTAAPGVDSSSPLHVPATVETAASSNDSQFPAGFYDWTPTDWLELDASAFPQFDISNNELDFY
ncbi:hypothetical protein MAPG_10268 [Magnaporthiopsis poae ATCC 64411]|uniref:Zn(2)-C6 fungal-type domain-containing protein n=1 Tax=Magnaporthiopsis poae (strain ATCC 64411 / 73-15) TaxID=644358 RepID=A0A0C4EC54_MAGP6|nr:hypothetical protein MAPG_10268 [Magnaporthiopsis poae ATCC 64411]